MKAAVAFVWIGSLAFCDARPSGLGKRATPITSLSDVAASYDYVIVGGGTSGLTVADRLTEDSTSEFAFYPALASEN